MTLETKRAPVGSHFSLTDGEAVGEALVELTDEEMTITAGGGEGDVGGASCGSCGCGAGCFSAGDFNDTVSYADPNVGAMGRSPTTPGEGFAQTSQQFDDGSSLHSQTYNGATINTIGVSTPTTQTFDDGSTLTSVTMTSVTTVYGVTDISTHTATSSTPATDGGGNGGEGGGGAP